MPAASPEFILLLLANVAGIAGVTLSRNSGESEETWPPEVSSGPLYPWSGSSGNRFCTSAVRSSAPQALRSKPSWTFRVGEERLEVPGAAGSVAATPLVDDQLNIYLSVVSGSIHKISPEGKILWTHQRPPLARLPGAPTLMDGSLFSADTSGTVFALDMRTGATRWSQYTGLPVGDDAWSVAAGEGVVVVPFVNPAYIDTPGQRNRRFGVFIASVGAPLWFHESKDGDPFVNMLVSIRKGSLFFTDSAAVIHRMDLYTGAQKWKAKAKKDIAPTASGVAISPKGDVVFATWNEVGFQLGDVHGVVAAFDSVNGKLLWSHALEYPTVGQPAVGTLGSGPTATLAVVVAAGTSPLKPRGVLTAFGNQSKARVVGISAEGPGAGTLLFSRDLERRSGAAAAGSGQPSACAPRTAFSTPTISGNGAIYLGFENGDLAILHDDNADMSFESSEVDLYNVGAAFNAAPVLAPGMLIAAPCDGLHVWRWQDGATPVAM